MATREIGGPNRGYMEIIYSILEASMKGALKTHIMFKCHLNSKQLQLYLQFLVDKNLLERYRLPQSLKIQYKTSELGRRYAESYETLIGLVGSRKPAGIPLRA